MDEFCDLLASLVFMPGNSISKLVIFTALDPGRIHGSGLLEAKCSREQFDVPWVGLVSKSSFGGPEDPFQEFNFSKISRLVADSATNLDIEGGTHPGLIKVQPLVAA